MNQTIRKPYEWARTHDAHRWLRNDHRRPMRPAVGSNTAITVSKKSGAVQLELKNFQLTWSVCGAAGAWVSPPVVYS